MDQAIKEWLARYGVASVWDSIENDVLWGSCFKQKKLRACRDACANPPDRLKTLGNLYCRQPSKFAGFPYFAACMEAYDDEFECFKLCPQPDYNPPCKVATNVGRRFCSNPKDYVDNEERCKAARFSYDPGLVYGYCGTREKYLANEKICKVVQPRGPPLAAPTTPAAARTDQECAGLPRASDGQCLGQGHNRGWSALADCPMTERTCQERWIQEHERELCQKDPKRSGCATTVDGISAAGSQPFRQEGCEKVPIEHLASDDSCWKQPGGDSNEMERWYQTLRDQGITDPVELEKAAAMLYRESHDQYRNAEKSRLAQEQADHVEWCHNHSNATSHNGLPCAR